MADPLLVCTVLSFCHDKRLFHLKQPIESHIIKHYRSLQCNCSLTKVWANNDIAGLEKSGRIVAFCDWKLRFCDQKVWCSRNFVPKPEEQAHHCDQMNILRDQVLKTKKFRGREDCTSRSEVYDLMMLMKTQLLAAEKREERLEKMLRTSVSATAAQPPAAVMKSKQISAERPVLLSTASLAEFSAWEESWYDYAVCRQLAAQSHETRVSAVRLSFDEEIRRYLREGIIKVSPNADVPEFIKAVKMFIRGQRNSLLD